MDLIDSHSHLDVAEFDIDRHEVLERARHAGVTRQIVPAISVSAFAKLRDLCHNETGLYPAFGLHPMYVREHRREHLDQLVEWIGREHPVAVGECGLDFYIDDPDVESQRGYFIRQLEIAKDFDLPVILHARRAVDEVIASIRKIGKLRGVVHSFSGSAEQAQQLWRCGFSIGIGGPITYSRAHRLRGIVASMPLEFLLLETDSPDQPLHGHQGARNEPALLLELCACIANLRNTSMEEISIATTRNAEQLFALRRSRHGSPEPNT